LDRSPGLDKQSIVSAALDIIAERGVAGLSMRLLSQRLGVSLGATYRHVPNKDDLLRLVAADLYARITPADDPGGDEFDQAKHVMLQIHDLLAAYPGMAAHIAQNLPEFTSSPTRCRRPGCRRTRPGGSCSPSSSSTRGTC
jgi:AcrR family transcriptional regulator